MSNKETLQSYNNRLNANNTNLEDVLSTINGLPKMENLDAEITAYDSGLTEQEGQLETVIQKLKNKAGVKTPEVGFIINEWDVAGYPTSVTFQKMAFLFTGMLRISTSGYPDILTRITTVNLPETTDELPEYACTDLSSLVTINGIKNATLIRNYAFQNCIKLQLTELPSNLSSLGSSAFQNCYAITVKKLPNTLTTLNSYVFAKCISMTQLSMPSVTTISSMTANSSSFANCTGLKAIWIGSAITNSGLNNYAFSTCTNLTKMFIDLPRATIETYSSYSTYSSKIICNDDDGFMTQEEFDAIDWATYSA